MNTATKDRLVRLSVFLAWFLFILTLLATGKLAIFIRQSFAPMAIAATLILAGLIINTLKERPAASHPLTWRILILFLFPLALVLVAQPGTLSTLAAAKQGVVSDVKMSDAELLDVLKARVEQEGRYRSMTLKQVLAAAKEKPAQVNGMLISTEGLVLKDKNGGADTFVLLRFLMFCCAADATPLGLPVVWEKPDGLKQDAWVRVSGRLVIEQTGARIIGEEVTVVPPPSDPYLH